MQKLKFKPTDKTVDFFNEFSVIDNLSVERMLNRILSWSSSPNSFDAAIILLWYFILCIDNLDSKQTDIVIFSLMTLLICSTTNDTFNIDNALEMLEMTYNDIVRGVDAGKAKSGNDMEIPPKIKYGTTLKVQLSPPAMQIKKYSKAQGVTIAEAIENKIEEMRPINLKIAEDIIHNRFIYMVSNQTPLHVCGTIFLFLSLLILNRENIKTHFYEYFEALKKNCIKNMETNYKYRRIKEFKEKIYKND